MQAWSPVEAAVPPPVGGAAAAVLPALRWDPRLYQIATLSGLLGYGVFWLDLEVQTRTAVAMIVTAVVTQLVCTRLTGRGRFDPRSALISALSLCLLLRTGSLGLAMLTAAVAIASKFTLRVRDKHVFNPTNFALVAMMLATGNVWVSPGQWGSGLVFAFLLASAGGLVVNRAARADVTLAFLASWASLLVARSLRPRCWPSAASTSPGPTRSCSTRPRRSCWSATTTRPSSPWPTTSRATSRSSPSWCPCRPSSRRARSA